MSRSGVPWVPFVECGRPGVAPHPMAEGGQPSRCGQSSPGGGDVSRLVDVAAPVPKLPPSAVRPPAVRTSERLTSQSRVVTCHGPGYPGSPSSGVAKKMNHGLRTHHPPTHTPDVWAGCATGVAAKMRTGGPPPPRPPHKFLRPLRPRDVSNFGGGAAGHCFIFFGDTEWTRRGVAPPLPRSGPPRRVSPKR